MDDTDKRLLALLSENPRMQVRELAKKLGISRQAVHHRLRTLQERGISLGTSAAVSIGYLDAVTVSFWGVSRSASMDKTLEKLGENDCTRRVLFASGNMTYVVAFLRNISNLDEYTRFVRQAADIPDVTVGIYSHDDALMPYNVDGTGTRKQGYKCLSPLDLKIVAALQDDARRPVAVIADIVGVTPKTVRKHLSSMISDGALDMNAPQDMSRGGDLLIVMHVNLDDALDRRGVGRHLLSKRYFLDQYIRTFSNIQNLLIWVFWSDDIRQIRKAIRETSEETGVRSVVPHFIYYERIFPTWREKMPEVQIRISEKRRGLERT